MEGVVEALNRARTLPFDAKSKEAFFAGRDADGQALADPFRAVDIPTTAPSSRRLKNERIVAFDATDPHTRIFDLLRNSLLASLTSDAPQVIAVASATHGCGASVIASNLAFSIARKRSWQVLLATLDGASQVHERIGLGVPARRSAEVLGADVAAVEVDGTVVHVGNLARVLAGEGRTVARHVLVSEWMARVRRECRATIVVLDLPPLLTNDDSQSIAGEADLALLVLGVGASTVADLEACRGSLVNTPHQIILNKARSHGL